MMAGGRWGQALVAAVAGILLAGCGGSSSDQSSGSGPSGTPGANVVPITLGGGTLCTQYVNQPCVSVTICIPNTPQCQTINDILLDTGSIGLRVFRSILTVDLSPRIERDGQGNAIGECVIFGTGADWGPVATAGVVLAEQPQVTVPIQLIDASFAGQTPARNPCRQPVDDTPVQTGLNGILGIDAFGSDEGGGVYFSCTAQGCSGTPIDPPDFVKNPIAALPADNNGYVISLPAVGNSGAPTVSGTLVMGVGTQTNNTPPSVTVLARAPATGTITTTYKGTTYPSFLDTGSTFLFFPDSTIPTCQRIDGAFCPPTPLNLTATNHGVNGSASEVRFQIVSAESLETTGNGVFNNIGGPNSAVSGFFDWGLPFFLGRTLYTGMAGRDSVLGMGPYWAY
jgi:hypothetical protein